MYKYIPVYIQNQDYVSVSGIQKSNNIGFYMLTTVRRYSILFHMAIMITGATGLPGRAVYAQLTKNKNFKVVGTGFSRAEPPLEKLNLRNREDVDSFLDKHKPDCIVHCAAERRPSYVIEAEPEASEELNVGLTGYFAEQAKRFGSCMVYISTDYVFDGTLHFSGAEVFTKYAMTLSMAESLRVEKECISPDRTASGAARRPENSHIDTSHIDEIISIPGSSFNDRIKRDLQRLFVI